MYSSIFYANSNRVFQKDSFILKKKCKIVNISKKISIHYETPI